jgi:hypothetical protein
MIAQYCSFCFFNVSNHFLPDQKSKQNKTYLTNDVQQQHNL